jgi:hypothetical protein
VKYAKYINLLQERRFAMFRESNFEGRPTSPVFPDEDVLRRPDGTIDFDAYTARARRARSAAVVALFRAAWSLLAGLFAGAGKSMPAARHRGASC